MKNNELNLEKLIKTLEKLKNYKKKSGKIFKNEKILEKLLYIQIFEKIYEKKIN